MPPVAARLLVSLSFASLAAGILSAQDVPASFRPPSPDSLTPGPAPTGETPKAVRPASTATIRPSLRGLVLLSSVNAVQKSGLTAPGLDTRAVPALATPAFATLAGHYLDQPFSSASLAALIRDIVRHYRNQLDRPVVDVFAPEQDLTSGVLQLVVIEGRLGKVRAEGQRWFTAARITGAVHAQPGAVIVGDPLREDVAWLNRNPFRTTSAVFKAGATAGETDLVLRTHDRLPLRVYTGIDDTGGELTGDYRAFLGATWGDVGGLDHLLSYQYTADPAFDHFEANTVSYLVPLPWRHTLSFLGNYSTAEATSGALNLKGYSWQAGTRYTVPLPRARRLRQQADLGFDLKKSNSDLGFAGSSVFASATTIAEFSAGYSAGLADSLGNTNASLSLTHNPGGWDSSGDDAAFAAARARAEARFTRLNFNLERQTRLGEIAEWSLRFTAQWADGNLLAGEQLGLGGYDSVRGYEERSAAGDRGMLLRNELRTAARRLPASLPGRWQGLVFWDWGTGWSVDPLPAEPRSTTLGSVGPGLRYDWTPWASLRADYGWITRHDQLLTSPEAGRAHFSVTIGY